MADHQRIHPVEMGIREADYQRIHPVEMSNREADHQRIHPVEMASRESIHAVEVSEASSTSEPLPPSGSARSTKDEADDDLPSQLPPPPPAGATAAEQATPSSEAPTTNRQYRRCLGWCCWSFLILLILILLVCTFFALLLLIFRPKAPNYTFNSLRVTSFAITPTANTTTISASFDIQVTLRNPNKHVGIYYLQGNNVSVFYRNTSLCTGSVPKFYQGSKNTTVLHILLRGEVLLEQGQVQALQAGQRARQIPLQVRARVPVKLKFGTLKLWKMRFSVRCDFQVYTLASGSVIPIQGTSHCHGFKKKLL